ncbi:spinster family MFS transporter [Hyphobacterium marinum]|uniref:MFS transporter n=1 Tax=Hyphobacterium marinum TaxID=3116574 RepID=A0ABU7LVW2_9PROT|nr:MFS transporter [Hyphobacterium sp. Y6023]MEE2565699.1 MFS transporter [Hyphobacterium sp. Y6023]
MEDAAPKPVSNFYRNYVVGGLFVIYTFNFIDRQIVAVMQEPIKAEFGLADWQLGLLSGWAFAFLYAILGLPIAYLADRSNRVTIISISLAVWSGFTALFGLANSYLALFLMRVGVGIGEAGCSPPAHSLISDYVPPRKRAGALSVYSLGIPVGSVLGILGGAVGYRWVANYYAEFGAPGWLAAIGADEAWRVPFLLVGIPGIILAVIVKLTIKEPPRGPFDGAEKQAMPSVGKVFGTLLKKPTFWLVAFGAAIASLVGYGLFPWILSYFVRLYAGEMPLQDAVAAAAIPYSFVIGGGGFIGTLAGGWLTDRFSGQRLSAYLVIPGTALLISLPIYFVSMSISPGTMAFVLLGIASALGAMWYGPVWAVTQNLVPPGMRAMAPAILLFIINIIGLGIGPFAVGALSDYFTAEYGGGALRIAILAIAALIVPAAALFLMGARSIRHDWEATA